MSVRVIGASGRGAMTIALQTGDGVADLRRSLRIMKAPFFDECGTELNEQDACPANVWIFSPPSRFERLPDEVLSIVLGFLQHYPNGAASASSLILLSRRLYFSKQLRSSITIAKFVLGWGPDSGGGRCGRRLCKMHCDSNMIRVSKLFANVQHFEVRPPLGCTTPGTLWAKVAAEVVSRWKLLSSVKLVHVLLLAGGMERFATEIPPSDDPQAVPPLFGRCRTIVVSSAVKTACMSLTLLESIGAALELGSPRSLSLDSVEARELHNPVAAWQASCLTKLTLGSKISEFLVNAVLEGLGRGGSESKLVSLELPCGNRNHPYESLGGLVLPSLAELCFSEWPCHSMRWRESLQNMLVMSNANLEVLGVKSSALQCFELSRIVRACQCALLSLRHLDLSGTLVGGCDLVLSLSRLTTVAKITAPLVKNIRSAFPVGLELLEDVRVGESQVSADWDVRGQPCLFITSLIRRCPLLTSVCFSAPDRSRSEVQSIEDALRLAKLPSVSISWRGGGVEFSSGIK